MNGFYYIIFSQAYRFLTSQQKPALASLPVGNSREFLVSQRFLLLLSHALLYATGHSRSQVKSWWNKPK